MYSPNRTAKASVPPITVISWIIGSTKVTHVATKLSCSIPKGLKSCRRIFIVLSYLIPVYSIAVLPAGLVYCLTFLSTKRPFYRL
jgi:hypothetical protein